MFEQFVISLALAPLAAGALLTAATILLFLVFGVLMMRSRLADIRALQELRTRRLARERRRK